MNLLIEELGPQITPERLAEAVLSRPGVVLLRTALFAGAANRYSFLAADPFLVLTSSGYRCEISSVQGTQVHFGNPWSLLERLLARYELNDERDWPFPLGGCFGFWGYDLRRFNEPKLAPAKVRELDLPDCHLGFYDALVVFDHALGKTWVVSTGLKADGTRDRARAMARARFWKECAAAVEGAVVQTSDILPASERSPVLPPARVRSSFSKTRFIAAVQSARRYIQAGDIYQVNLAQRFEASYPASGWQLFQSLSAGSPAPYAAYLDCGSFQLVSSSPELFLRLSGSHVTTRPIKGTRPRASDPTRDTQLRYELQTSPKEMAELVMITDLLRNDLGRFCEYGSIRVPELARLEQFSHVHHLVATVEGELRQGVSHLEALSACFPGGSVTGAPKFRAMQIIDELEPVSRGPYTGCHGYLGFNRESQVSITIRTMIARQRRQYFHAGAGIVFDSDPEAEYAETLAKSGGFLAAIGCAAQSLPSVKGVARVPLKGHLRRLC